METLRDKLNNNAIKKTRLLPIEEIFELKNIREKYDPESIKTLKEILLKHQGAMSVIIELINNGDDRNRFVLKQMKIKLTNTFINEVQKLYGEESVWLVPK